MNLKGLGWQCEKTFNINLHDNAGSNSLNCLFTVLLLCNTHGSLNKLGTMEMVTTTDSVATPHSQTDPADKATEGITGLTESVFWH